MHSGHVVPSIEVGFSHKCFLLWSVSKCVVNFLSMLPVCISPNKKWLFASGLWFFALLSISTYSSQYPFTNKGFEDSTLQSRTHFSFRQIMLHSFARREVAYFVPFSDLLPSTPWFPSLLFLETAPSATLESFSILSNTGSGCRTMEVVISKAWGFNGFLNTWCWQGHWF